MTSDEIRQLKDSVDITELIGHVVELKKVGVNYVGLCPFHKEKSASFSVSSMKQIYHCFGCGIGGDVINFIQRFRRTTFVDALNRLQKYKASRA